MNKTNKRISVLILIMGIIVSISAALYSVIGLSQLFSGAKTQVIIMASSLEISKIVIATALKLYWNDIQLKLKSYLILAVIILMLITSIGIYGFLSAAYRNVFDLNQTIENKITLIEKKQLFYSDNIKYLENEKNTLLNNLKILTDNYNSVNQSVDRKTGQLNISINSKSQGRIDNQINNINNSIEGLNIKLFNYSDSINKLEEDKLILKNNDVVTELGPLKYISKITNTDMDIIVNYLILLIIFVFDPLAIALLILGLNILLISAYKISKVNSDYYNDNINNNSDSEINNIIEYSENPTVEYYDNDINELQEYETKETGIDTKNDVSDELSDLIDRTFNDGKYNFNRRIETHKK